MINLAPHRLVSRASLWLAVLLAASHCGDPAMLARSEVVSIDDMLLRDSLHAQYADSALPSLPLPADGEPLVLVHGMAGFRPIATLLDYFYGVRRSMSAQGYSVFALQTDAFQSIAHRGAQLAVQIDEVLRLTGAARVHVIAHSQGGLDARYVIAHLGYGDRIATLITVGTPHRGVRLIDLALDRMPGGMRPVAHVVNAVADALLGGHNNLLAQLHDLRATYVTETFNPAHPDDPRVAYYTYAGLTQANPFVNRRRIDIVNPLLMGTHKLIVRSDGANDGLVTVQSAQWGTYLGAIAADHWDQIGQPPALPHPAFDHLGFYHALAKFLGYGGTPPLFD